MNIPNPLISDISEGRASLLLGAGASIEAGFPASVDLAQHIAKRAGAPHVDLLQGKSLDYVAEYLNLQRGFGLGWVRREIINLFEQQHQTVKSPPSFAHGLITSIRWRSIFTTNYDRLVEIAYDSSSIRVQRCLPFYVPDPAVFETQKNQVRLIKLNGSVDEAARNSKHELVLTFSEQQSALRKNRAFYELLRQEAINGPIVFVGFRFLHPGAILPGTSPEFEELRNLLREMGPSARHHYCITPYEPESLDAKMAVAILESSGIMSLNASFGDFCVELRSRLVDRPEALEGRPLITVPVSNEALHINPDDFENDTRHFEILGDQIQRMRAPLIANSLNGQDNWASFVHGHFIERSSHAEVVRIIDELTRRVPQILFLEAPAGWGKTCLLKNIAVEYYFSARPVIWLNPVSTLHITNSRGKLIQLGSWDSRRLDVMIGQIMEIASRQNIDIENAAPIIIADNCVDRTPEVLALFRELAQNNRKFVLVFSARDTETDTLIESYPLLRRAVRVSPAQTTYSRDEVRKLIDFCIEHEIAVFEDETQRSIVAQRIIDDGADQALILALQVIFDKQHRPFSEIVASWWQRLAPGSPRDLVTRVATWHRYGSNYMPRLYTLMRTFSEHEPSEILGTYNECLQQGILFEKVIEDEPCVGTLHPLVAEKLLEVSQTPQDQSNEEFLRVISSMSAHSVDLEMIRGLCKRLTDYHISLSSDAFTDEFFQQAAQATGHDWVICQQYAKYLLQRFDFELALTWAEYALESNPGHPPLHHTKGNVLRRWGMKLRAQRDDSGAREKFDEASECFARSRMLGVPDEYGYVTHLDMLTYLINHSADGYNEANLIAEGSALYREGLRTVPKDRFNLLLEQRFRDRFQLTDDELKDLCLRIGDAVDRGKSSTQAAIFLAQEFNAQGAYERALEIIYKQRAHAPEDLALLVAEAETHARNGEYAKAGQLINMARRRIQDADDVEAKWSVMYWDILVAVALEDYDAARTAIQRLQGSAITRTGLPRGYYWRSLARSVPKGERVFEKHARIFEGRIKDTREGGSYGQVEIQNTLGEILYIVFNPRYWSRRDFRRGNPVRFVMTILPNGLRADEPSSTPFLNTIDDLYLR